MSNLDRKSRGERAPHRVQHYDLCDGVCCPCHQEGYKLGRLHGTRDAIGHLLVWAEQQRGSGA